MPVLYPEIGKLDFKSEQLNPNNMKSDYENANIENNFEILKSYIGTFRSISCTL